jgi:hypothetical protein
MQAAPPLDIPLDAPVLRGELRRSTTEVTKGHGGSAGRGGPPQASPEGAFDRSMRC